MHLNFAILKLKIKIFAVCNDLKMLSAEGIQGHIINNKP